MLVVCEIIVLCLFSCRWRQKSAHQLCIHLIGHLITECGGPLGGDKATTSNCPHGHVAVIPPSAAGKYNLACTAGISSHLVNPNSVV